MKNKTKKLKQLFLWKSFIFSHEWISLANDFYKKKRKNYFKLFKIKIQKNKTYNNIQKYFFLILRFEIKSTIILLLEFKCCLDMWIKLFLKFNFVILLFTRLNNFRYFILKQYFCKIINCWFEIIEIKLIKNWTENLKKTSY